MIAPLGRRGKKGRAVVPSSMCNLSGRVRVRVELIIFTLLEHAHHAQRGRLVFKWITELKYVLNKKVGFHHVLEERKSGKASLGMSRKVWYEASPAATALLYSSSSITGA